MMLLVSTNAFSATIGDVILQEGTGVIERKDGDEFSSRIDLDIFSYDTVKTGQGKTAIEFVDDTRVDVTEHSKLIIDEFVYDPNTKTGALSLKASLGTVRYASGQIAKNSKQNVKIKTPTATIGVRGTDFSMTIDEIGSSTIILLPSCDTSGNCYVGEIDVTSDAGQVIMNQAFQATVVETPDSKPMKPVKLEIDENLIGNLLIISKPREIEEQQTKERLAIIANALDLDFLEFEELNVDYLEDETENWATGLDIDFLEQNFLADILEQINRQLALQMRNEFDKEKTKTDVTLGKDPETGIILLDEDPDWLWSREDAAGNKIELRLNKEHGYVLNITQQDFEIIDYEIGGPENEITIYQASSLFMLLILLTLFAFLSFANDVTVTITTTDGGTFNVEQDGEDNNIDYDIESMDEFVINLDQTGNDNNINIDVDGRTSVGSSMTINQTGNNKSYTGNLY